MKRFDKSAAIATGYTAAVAGRRQSTVSNNKLDKFGGKVETTTIDDDDDDDDDDEADIDDGEEDDVMGKGMNSARAPSKVGPKLELRGRRMTKQKR